MVNPPMPHSPDSRRAPARGAGKAAWVWVAVVVLGVGLLAGYYVWQKARPAADSSPVLSFSGGTESLPGTVIMPVLNSLLPQGKNAVWCSTFQVAWNKLKNDILKEPIKLKNAQQVADCLNNAPQGEQDLPPESYYAAAGSINKGIAAQIRKEMARKFPDAPPPQFATENLPPELAPFVAYAYLAANLRFTKQYNDQPAGLMFKDSGGKETLVAAFGFWKTDPDAKVLAGQARVLWLGDSSGAGKGQIDEFIVDACQDSQPNQIVLAMVKPKATLDETYKYVQRSVDAGFSYGEADCLIVPNLFWRISHHFSELEGVYLLNPSFKEYFICNAQQDIELKLDRSGAKLVSEAKLEIAKSEERKEDSAPLYLIFNHPFLLYMKKRGAAQPFLVMWVDNAKLLAKR